MRCISAYQNDIQWKDVVEEKEVREEDETQRDRKIIQTEEIMNKDKNER